MKKLLIIVLLFLGLNIISPSFSFAAISGPGTWVSSLSWENEDEISADGGIQFTRVSCGTDLNINDPVYPCQNMWEFLGARRSDYSLMTFKANSPVSVSGETTKYNVLLAVRANSTPSLAKAFLAFFPVTTDPNNRLPKYYNDVDGTVFFNIANTGNGPLISKEFPEGSKIYINAKIQTRGDSVANEKLLNDNLKFILNDDRDEIKISNDKFSKSGDGYAAGPVEIKQKMYSNKTYYIRTNFPTDKYVDCADPSKDTATLGSLVTETCKLEYFGTMSFKLSEDGNIITLDADDYEKQSEGKNISGQTSGNGFKLTIQEKFDSPLDKALSSTIKWLANLVETGLKVTMNWVDSLLNSTDEYVLGKGTPGNTGVEPAWTKIRNISLTLLVLALIVIAFANVFQVNIEQYGLNRMIPKIIIAIIMAYMSWVFVLFFFDLASVIQAQANSFLSSGSGISLMGSVSIQTPTSADIMAKMGAILVLIILLFGAWVCGIVLLFLLLLRIVMLSFLLAVAPMAMIANIMPFTSNLYKKWWNEFFKWMFMGPIATAIIALGTIIATNTGFGTDTNKFDESVVSNASTPGSGVNLLVGILILAASMYMAATLPLKWGGNLMGRWAGAGKKLWGNTGGKALGGVGALGKGVAGLAGMGAVAGFRKIPGIGRLADISGAYQMGKKQFTDKVEANKRIRSAELLDKTAKANPFLNKDDAESIRGQMFDAHQADFSKKGFEAHRSAYDRAISDGNYTLAGAIQASSDSKFGAGKIGTKAGQVDNNGDWTTTDLATREQWESAGKNVAATNLANALISGKVGRNERKKLIDSDQEISMMAVSALANAKNPDGSKNADASRIAGQILGGAASSADGSSVDKVDQKFIKQIAKRYEEMANPAKGGNQQRRDAAVAEMDRIMSSGGKDGDVLKGLTQNLGLEEHEAITVLQAQKLAYRDGNAGASRNKYTQKTTDAYGKVTSVVGQSIYR